VKAETPLHSLLGMTAPVILAPMALVAGGALASAVSAAGGLGLIGGGYGDRAWLERELDTAGKARIGVGFISWALENQPDLLALALKREPCAILLSFGSVRRFASTIHNAGIPLIVQVQTVADACIAVSEGAAVIVAQGTEAGGHSGTRGTIALVPAVVDAVSPIPVVAAGGIADGRGLAAAMMLGAQAVLCGTAFYAARESLAHVNAKRATLDASGDQTVRSALFDAARGYVWPPQWQARSLVNDFQKRWSAEAGISSDRLKLMQEEYRNALTTGDTGTMAVFVGEAVNLVQSEESATAILHRIMNEAHCRLSGHRSLGASA
jgi:nitronate monooxygenase